MAYDAYGRPLQGNGEPGYFEGHDTMPEYTSYYSGEPRDENPGLRRAGSYRTHRASPAIPERMAAAADQNGPASFDNVSPELLAALTEKITETVTERVKKEFVEHLKQTGSVEDQPKAPPMQRMPSNRSSSTSSPPPTARRVYTPPSPTQYSKPPTIPPPMESRRSPPSSPSEKSGVRFSTRDPTIRPATTRGTELSTIDQKWGILFDAEGLPGPRLGQFLRGLANHIIEDFLPKKSIVVTPSKMAMFYANHTLSKEPHPFLEIFRTNEYENISRLYRDVGAEHFFTQENCTSTPSIPSLTPLGFARWMTVIIQAYPHEEWTRLEKVVLAMPIDADGDLVDGKPERLPKQISRHLLPDHEDRKLRKLLDNAVSGFLVEFGSDTKRKASITSPPLSRRSSSSATRAKQGRASPASPGARTFERERKPYSGAPSSDASSNDEPIKIERDRQPYSAQPGAGKVHADSNANLNIPGRPGRSNSTATRPTPRDPACDPRHSRTQSTASQNYAPRPSGRRTSSPPFRNFSQSTPEDLSGGSKYVPNPPPSSQTFGTSPYGSTGSFPPPPGPPPIDIRGDRRSRDDRYRRATEDFPGELNSPRDAERWDRYQDMRGEGDRYGPYDRASISVDPREMRGAPAEEWYRDNRGSEYDPYRRY